MPYINSLDRATPSGGTMGDQIDDELRDFKDKVLSTFPNIDGAITATDTELNYLVGATSALQTQITNLSNQISDLENKTYVEHGYVDSAGTGVSLPSGWTSAHIATGHYRITHNLGYATTRYGPSAQPKTTLLTVGAGIVYAIATTYFDLRFAANALSLVDTDFTFQLAIST